MANYHLLLLITCAALCHDVKGDSWIDRIAAEVKANAGPTASSDDADIQMPAIVVQQNPWKHEGGRLEKGDELGRGGFGVVFKAHDKVDDCHVAVKMMLPGTNQEKAFKALKKEVSIMEVVQEAGQQPNIISMRRAFAYKGADGNDEICVSMELLEGGNLEDLVNENNNKNQAMSMRMAAAYMKTMATAFKFLHDTLNIIHFDVKPENLGFRTMARQPEDLVLLDFGLAKRYSCGDTDCVRGGTPGFIPPFRDNFCPFDMLKLSDSYALGITLYMMTMGAYPVEEIPLGPQVDMINNFQLKDLLHHLTSEDPAKMFTADQILAHPFLKNEDDVPASKRSWGELERSSSVPQLHEMTLAMFVETDDASPSHTLRGQFIFNKLIHTEGEKSEYQVSKDGKTMLLAKIMPRTEVVQKQLLHDMLVLSTCKSDAIVDLHTAYMYKTKIMVVSDLMEGPSLLAQLDRKKLVIVFARMVKAIASLHEEKFNHGNLSMESFGYRRSDNSNLVMHYLGENKGSVKDDIRNLIIILYTLATGAAPALDSDGKPQFTLVNGVDKHLRSLFDMFDTGAISTCEDIIKHSLIQRELNTGSYYIQKVLKKFRMPFLRRAAL